jgi:hypothetical protein
MFINVCQKKHSFSRNRWNLRTTNQIRIRVVLVVIVRWLDLRLPMQSVPITTEVVSSNPTQVGST